LVVNDAHFIRTVGSVHALNVKDILSDDALGRASEEDSCIEMPFLRKGEKKIAF